MASNFWIGASVSVTANSKLVTVLSSSDDITKIKEGAAFVASNYSIPFEVNRTYNDGSNDIIELKENWTGATSSSVSATVVVGPGAIASTREAIVNLISAYEAFEALVTPTVTANGLAQRTATGQLKTANAVNNDEAVAKGQFNSLTQSYLNTFGLGQYTQQPNWPNSNIDNCNGVASGVYRTSGSIISPDQTAIVYFSRRNSGQLQQILISGYDSGNTNTFQWRNSNGGSDSAPVWGEWKTVYHSGNSVNPLDFGIGGQGVNFESDDANTGIDSGIYRATSSTANTPISGTSTIIVTRSYNVVTQLFCNGSRYYFRRSVDSGSNWDDWREIYHSGNSVNPLDFGLGDNTGKTTTDWNTARNGGFYLATANNQVNSPDNGLNWVGCVMSLNAENTAQILWRAGSGSSLVVKTRFGGPSGVWTDWEDFYHSGNSINPVDYGLGTDSTIDLVEFTDFNDLTKGGFYRNAYTSSVANAPYTGNETWCVSVLPAGGINVIQIVGGTTKKRYFMRTAAGNVWNDWNEIYHSGNSANPLDYGAAVKNKTLAAGHNLDTLIDNGTYTGFGQGSLSSSTGDNPFTGNGAFTITVSRETFGSDNYTMQTATWYANNVGILQKQRVKSTNVSGWTDWYDVLNTSNTNFDEFGGINGDDIAVGWARGTTTAYLQLPLSAPVDTPATGINVTGSFEVRDFTNNTLLGTVTASDFSFVRPSNKLILVLVQNLTGLTGQQPIILRTASSYAKIKVTF